MTMTATISSTISIHPTFCASSSSAGFLLSIVLLLQLLVTSCSCGSIASETVSLRYDPPTASSQSPPPSHKYIQIKQSHPNRRIRSPDDGGNEDDEDAEQSCERFVSPIKDNKTFFSPLNPRGADTYPPRIDCTFVLEADPDHLIKLDFRNSFNIEPSPDCEFDYLEVHDGKHGFSKELGRFCGMEFPQIIYSSDRYMWLHFHSDENIEYAGFQAVYEYVPRPTTSVVSSDQPCVMEVTGSEGYISNEDIDKAVINNTLLHKLSLDCLWKIEVPEDWKILLTFDKFDLERKNDCESNFIDVFGEVTDLPSRLKNFCGVIGEAVVSKSNILHIRFFADFNAIKNTKFIILFTAFRKKDKGSDCADGEFDCEDDTCIDENLRCNGHVNCKFLKDENECPSNTTTDSGNLVIIIVVFCLILAAMISAFLFNCIRKLIRDQKIIREHIRQSKESKLDEAGRISLKRSLENINRIMPSNNTLQPMPQRQLHPSDHDANRYYQENAQPSMAQETRNHRKNDHNFRNLEIKDSLTTSLASNKKSSSENDGDDVSGTPPVNNMCDMACQTRSSLFASNASSREASSIAPGPPRFSTFGYNDQSRRQSHAASGSYQHQHQQQSSHSPQSYGGQSPDGLPPPPPPAALSAQSGQSGSGSGSGGGGGGSQCFHISASNCTKHNRHNQATVGGGGGGGSKEKPKKGMEESRIFVDIRNSAPDVIIMTSH